VDAAGAFSIRDVFPVLSWYIENSARRFTSRHDVAAWLLPLSEILLLSTEIASSVIAQAPTRKSGLEMDAGQVGGGSLIVRPGERLLAIDYLRAWLRVNAAESVDYCDAYFSQADVEFLRLVLAEGPGSKVRILTSRKAVTEGGNLFTAESFLSEWTELIEQDPPETEILAVTSFGGNEILVHDRWLLSGSSGLRFGTSFNSIGCNKLSEISVLSLEEVASLSEEIEQYFRRERLVNGVRVNYSSVSL